MPKNIYYFAYGSNMDLVQMKMRCGDSFKLLGKTTLEGWEFYINNRSKANIAIDSTNDNSVVYGLLFEINKAALDSLDKSEGFIKVPKIYDRDIEKVQYNGNEVEAWVYIDKTHLISGKSDRSDYLQRIIKAAKVFGFPAEYIKHLESFLAN